ncbi:MAG TPA: hypothetical protein P5114_11750 [Hyphomicrobiaceae bacterium]|nr:hypothetical protein [Hyphomicrobiaceae bacterium]
MKAKILIAAAAILTTTTVAASAHSVRPVDRALHKQSHRIEQGRKSGQITWREGRKLRAEQRDIARVRSRYLSDGKLTAREYRDLRRRQQSASWHIVNEKHDGWRRPRFLPRVGR